MFEPPSNLRSAQNTPHQKYLGLTYDGGAGCYKNQISWGVQPAVRLAFRRLPDKHPRISHFATAATQTHNQSNAARQYTGRKARIAKIKEMKTAHEATPPETSAVKY